MSDEPEVVEEEGDEEGDEEGEFGDKDPDDAVDTEADG
jgi:hypothetical protein